MAADFCTFSLLPVPSKDSSSCSVVLSSDGKWKTSSFYLDSSGRASISLPLELKFPSETVRNEYLSKDCFHPRPSNAEVGATRSDDEKSSSSIGVEAKVALTVGSGEAIVATVETVKLLSTRLEGTSVIFDSDIIVLVSRPGGTQINSGDASGVKAALDVSAVLMEKIAGEVVPMGGLLGGVHLHPVPKRRVRFTRTPPFTLHASLTHALSLSAKSVSGPSMGQTFLALTIRHSGTHTEAITITNVALHPSHSQEGDAGDRTLPVADTSKIVKWGYAPRSDPKLPLTLTQHEAFSTILVVDAAQDSKCRTFCCPVSVTAVLGQTDLHNNRHRYQVVAAATTTWETSKAVIEPSDGFRIDLSLGQQDCSVGAPLTVNVKVRNLSAQTRDLMLLVSGSDAGAEEPDVAVVGDEGQVYSSKKDGYKLSVEGLSVDGSSMEGAARELVSVDDAYCLGVLQSLSTTEALLRFIPLRKGSLTIPNLQLVDRKSGKRYTCLHKLRATVQEAEL